MEPGYWTSDGDDDLIFGAAAGELDLRVPQAPPVTVPLTALDRAGDGDDDLVFGAAAWELQLVEAPPARE